MSVDAVLGAGVGAYAATRLAPGLEALIRQGIAWAWNHVKPPAEPEPPASVSVKVKAKAKARGAGK